MKYNRYQDSRDPRCADPELYCKYRTSCLIHFMEKNNEHQEKKGMTKGHTAQGARPLSSRIAWGPRVH